MSDFISRQDTIDRINEYIEEYSEIDSDGNHSEKWCAMKEAEMVVKEAPPVQPARTDGEWIAICGNLRCSKCNTEYPDLYPDYDKTKFCPNCGAINTRKNK